MERCDVQSVAGGTALREDVMYRCCRGYCVRRGCDVQDVEGGTALGEDVIYRVLQGVLRWVRV